MDSFISLGKSRRKGRDGAVFFSFLSYNWASFNFDNFSSSALPLGLAVWTSSRASLLITSSSDCPQGPSSLSRPRRHLEPRGPGLSLPSVLSHRSLLPRSLPWASSLRSLRPGPHSSLYSLELQCSVILLHSHLCFSGAMNELRLREP